MPPTRYLGRTPSSRATATPFHHSAPSTQSPAPSPQHHTPTSCLGRTPSTRQATQPRRKASPFHRCRAPSAQSTAPCRPMTCPRTQAGSGRTANYHPVEVHHHATGGTHLVARPRPRVNSRRRRRPHQHRVAAVRLVPRPQLSNIPHPQLSNTPKPHHVNITHLSLMPRTHFAPHPHPAPAQSATPISQLALLQPPMLLGPPQSILSEISIPSAPGHRGIGKFEVEVPAADTEQGTASELYRGRTPSRGRKRSRARKTKVEGEGVL